MFKIQNSWISSLSNEEFDELSMAEISANTENVYEFALCESRHEMPSRIDGALFPNSVNPADFPAMREMAENAIPVDCKNLVVYVTGLTAAMLAVVSVCIDREISLTAMHYDRNTGKYFPQEVTHGNGRFRSYLLDAGI